MGPSQTVHQELGVRVLGGGRLGTEPGGTSLWAGQERRGLGVEPGAHANEGRTGEPSKAGKV